MSERPNYPAEPQGGGGAIPSSRSEQSLEPPLLAETAYGEDAENVTARWNAISANFVENPRQAVTDADSLVAKALDQVTQSLVAQREELVRRWSSAREQISTEELRLCLQRYRALFQRLTNAAA